MDDESQSGPESGGSLRTKLEEALSTNASLANELASYKAKDLISAKGLKFVTPEDLSGVKLDEIEAKALEIEQLKGTQRETVVREVLEQKGLSGEDLDTAVNELLGRQEETTAALGRIRGLGRISAGRGPDPAETQLFGEAKIMAAYAKKG